MSRGRVDVNPKKRLVTWIIVLVICCGCFYAYTRHHGSSALEYGTAEDEEMGPDAKQMRTGVSDSIIAELTECNAALSQQHKKRQIPPTLAPIDALERHIQLSSHPLHKTSKPGITSIDINLSKVWCSFYLNPFHETIGIHLTRPEVIMLWMLHVVDLIFSCQIKEIRNRSVRSKV
ncbi:hypothetical protein REPUB_Repub13aG0120500 [Reevesia pubescens]